MASAYDSLIAFCDSEILKFQQSREVLVALRDKGTGAVHKLVRAKGKPGRPKKLEEPPKPKHKVSPEARKRIGNAVKQRWAEKR